MSCEMREKKLVENFWFSSHKKPAGDIERNNDVPVNNIQKWQYQLTN